MQLSPPAPVPDFYYVPSAGIAWMGTLGSWTPTWYALPPSSARSLNRVAAGLATFEPVFSRVLVGKHDAPDPNAYLRLYDELPAAERPPEGATRVSIRIPADPRNPWTSRAMTLDYVPDAKLLSRDGDWVRVPATLAATIDRDAGLPPAADGRGGLRASAANVAILAAAAVALVSIATVLVASRRRRRQAAHP